MITKELSEAFAEIEEIFKFLSEDEIRKVPEYIRQMINVNKSESFAVHINPEKSIEEQIINPKTRDLLVALYLEYWCPENEKEQMYNIVNRDYLKKQEILKDKYNIEDLFKKRKNDLKKHSGEVELVKYKESIFKKIWNMFRKIKYK